VKKVLVISDHRLQRSPSQRYRYEQYLGLLRSQGFEFTFSPIIRENDDKVFYSKGKILQKGLITFKSLLIRLKDWMRYDNFDIIFIQREALFIGSTFFERKAYKSKARVIFDFDDSIWLMDTSPGNKKWEWLKNPNKTKTNIANAHLVIAGNKYLLDYALKINKNSILIPTTVDCAYHLPMPEKRNSGKIIIGWSGSISTIKHFEDIVPVLKKLKEKYKEKIGFKVIGDPDYVNATLDIKGIAWQLQNEVEDLNAFDIGIMPLPNDEWAQGKCGLKGLTYMACGIPTVMSAVGVNSEIIEHGVNGFLVKTETDWINYLSQLIESGNLRTKLGEAGRKTVEAKYSVEANSKFYLKAFREMI
jgi:glycosyltransferase involved in cell wall biosynthesis